MQIIAVERFLKKTNQKIFQGISEHHFWQTVVFTPREIQKFGTLID